MSRMYVSVLVLVFCIIVSPVIILARPVSGGAVLEDSWTQMAPMSQARAGLGVAAVNGKIYAIGGSTASGQYPPDGYRGGFVGTNEEYDPKTDTWTTKASMPTPRDYFAIATYQNKIYCIGGAVGFTYDERTGFYGNILSGVNEVYDPETNTWATKKSMPYNGSHLRADVVNGKIYVLQSFILHVYDPATDVWQTEITNTPFIPPQGTASSPALAVVDNKIIVTGIYETGVGYSVRSEQKVLIYDADTASWSEGKTGPITVSNGMTGATTGANALKRVYVLGRGGPFPSQPTNQVYDPKADAWATANAMPTLRIDFGVAVVDDILYAIGGYSFTSQIYSMVTPVAVNEQYTPIGYGVPPEIKILSPLNQLYNESSASLIFTVNKPVNWVGYSLDGEENVTITGNTTIANMTNGLHTIMIYTNDTFGNMGTSAINFVVAIPEPFPVVPVAAVSVAAVVAGAGLLVYFKKRKR